MGTLSALTDEGMCGSQNEETTSGGCRGSCSQDTELVKHAAAELLFQWDSASDVHSCAREADPARARRATRRLFSFWSEREGEINLSQQRKTTLLMFIIYQLILFSNQVEMGRLSNMPFLI